MCSTATTTKTNNNDSTNKKTIQLIDFEYGGINYRAFDIANHFNEYAGGPPDDAVPDYTRLPTPGQQEDFVRRYLETAAQAKVNNNQSYQRCTSGRLLPPSPNLYAGQPPVLGIVGRQPGGDGRLPRVRLHALRRQSYSAVLDQQTRRTRSANRRQWNCCCCCCRKRILN